MTKTWDQTLTLSYVPNSKPTPNTLTLTDLCELHLVHALSSVPMEESFAFEHGCELLANPLEELLDGCAVANKCGGHLEPTGRNVTNGCLDIVGDPLHKVGAVLVLNVEHLLVHLLHGHASTEHGGHGEVSTVTRVAGRHHVLGVKHLLGQFGDTECPVLLGPAARQRGKPWHEEVETRKGDHVDSEFAEVSVELAGEPETSRDSTHCQGDEVVEVSVSGCGQLECAEADIVESLVVNAVALVRVLHQLVH